jgi:hypothetical protein
MPMPFLNYKNVGTAYESDFGLRNGKVIFEK